MDPFGGILGQITAPVQQLREGPLGQYLLNPIMDQVKQQFAPIKNALASISQPNPQQSSMFAQNQQFLQPGAGGFNTTLPPLMESQFRNWAGQNNIPFNMNGVQDYDMRGLFHGMMNGHPKAAGFDPSSGSFPHFWTTPYASSFSSQSQWARPNAPAPNGNGWSF